MAADERARLRALAEKARADADENASFPRALVMDCDEVIALLDAADRAEREAQKLRIDTYALFAERDRYRIRAETAERERDALRHDGPPVAWRVSFNQGDTWTIYEREPAELHGRLDVLVAPLYDSGAVRVDAYRRALRERDAERARAERLAAALPLARYGLAILEMHREDCGEVSGDTLQDEAERCGLLVNVTVTEPCGDECRCAEYYASDEWPVECLRYSPVAKAAFAALADPAPAPAAPASGVGLWCAPGDSQRERWLLWFDDADRSRAVYDEEAAAREAFAKAETLGWNCHLFRLARRADPAPDAERAADK